MSKHSPVDVPSDEEPRKSLRGTIVIVMAMAVFFAICWLGMLALLMHRR
ncbi:MAG: hypothetical protein JWN41_393 [Thermoleophilia bacterium]|nr:hypothetical protein [Thermoleophilia bacterium]